jgi:hypothetical protein
LKQPKRPDASPSHRLVERLWAAIQTNAPRDMTYAEKTRLADAIGPLLLLRPSAPTDRRPPRKRSRRPPTIDVTERQRGNAVLRAVLHGVNTARNHVAKAGGGTLATVDASAERQLGAWDPGTEGFPLWPGIVGALSLLARDATGVSMNLPTFWESDRSRAVAFLERAGQCAPPWTEVGVDVAALFRHRPDAVDRVRRCEYCGDFFLDASSTFLVQPARGCTKGHARMARRNRTQRPSGR